MTAFVYRAYSESGDLLYVGFTTQSAGSRLDYHRLYSPWFTSGCTFKVDEFPDAKAARQAEAEAISTEFPLWNIEGRSPNHPDGPARSWADIPHPYRTNPHFNGGRWGTTPVADVRITRGEGVTVTEAAKRLGITRRAVLGRIERGTLPAEKIGDGRTSAYLIREDDLDIQAVA